MKTILEPDQVAQKHHYHCDWQLSLSFNRLVAAERAAAARRAANGEVNFWWPSEQNDCSFSQELSEFHCQTCIYEVSVAAVFLLQSIVVFEWIPTFFTLYSWWSPGRLVKKIHVGIFLPSPACGFKWKVRKCLQFHNNIKFFIQQNIKKDNKANV